MIMSSFSHYHCWFKAIYDIVYYIASPRSLRPLPPWRWLHWPFARFHWAASSSGPSSGFSWSWNSCRNCRTEPNLKRDDRRLERFIIWTVGSYSQVHPGWHVMNPDSSTWCDATRFSGTSISFSWVFLLTHLMPNLMSWSKVRNSHLKVELIQS